MCFLMFKLNITLEVLIEFNISDGITARCALSLVCILMERGARVALLSAYSNTLRRWRVPFIIYISVSLC